VVAGLAGVAVLILLAGLIALIGLHQLGPRTDPLRAALWLRGHAGHPLVRRWLLLGALGSGLFALAFGVSLALRLRPPLHGAARWASEAEIRAEGLRDAGGILLGRRDGRFLSFGGSEHVLLHAPTRSGKGVGVVIPNLLSWPGSAVVLDIKRENYIATAGFRAEGGQEIALFDPLDPQGRTARYNPLSYINRRDPVGALDELQKIAGMLFPVHERTDPFWAEAARGGFIGVGGYVAETPALPFTLGEIFRQLTAGAPRTRFPAIIDERARAGRPLSPGCVSALTDFCSASENTFASIKQTITARMGLWLNPRVDQATSASDFDLRGLGAQRITLYLAASPDNMVRVAPLYNLLFQQLVDLNTRRLPPPGPAVAPVLLMMDEFTRLGVAGVIAHGFSFIAGYGLRILAVIQSPSQLRSVYGHDMAEEIIANCGVEVVFTPKELKIAQELSERLGAYTYAARSRSWPSLLSDGRRTTSESDQRRALRLPQELMQMDRGDLIVLRAGIPPVRGRKIVYHRERLFTGRLRPAPAHPGAPAPPSSGSPSPDTRRIAEPRLVVRPMTVSEAAGETPLTLEMIRPALKAANLDEGPADGCSEEEMHAATAAYIAAVVRPRRSGPEESMADESMVGESMSGEDQPAEAAAEERRHG
jgi:type IV secretion system protein VirD4